ncbi:MAG: DUF1491 family protein [Asticcacaulis sp.]
MLLATDLWVAALIRRAELGGAFAMVLAKGDARAGTVLVKALNRAAGTCRIYTEAFGAEGDRLWMRPVRSEDEAEIEAWIARQRSRDPDLWVVEIDDRAGRHFLTEKVDEV